MKNFLNGIELYTQKDPVWGNEIMTWATYQEKGDTLAEYGCLVTALCNLNNIFSKRIVYNPKTLNNMLKEKGGYRYLDNPGNCEKGKESYIVWRAVKLLFSCDVINDYTGPIEIEHPTRYYVANVKEQDAHYCFVLGGDRERLKYHDSNTGAIKRGKAYQVIRAEFVN